MSTIKVRETYVNVDRGYRYGEGEYDTLESDRGAVYRLMVSEYGRCIGKIYRDTDSGARAAGWVFQGRTNYEDGFGTYLRETWVEVLEGAL